MTVVPNKPKTPMRTVRVRENLWKAAQEVARERGESVSDEIRRALEKYVEKHQQ